MKCKNSQENNPIEPLDEPSEIELARQNTKSIEREEENNPGESSPNERVPETISKKSSKETNRKCNTEDSPKFKQKILLLQKRFEWFEYWFGEGAYCSTCRACALPSEKVKFWASKPHNIIKDDKAHISCENHGQSMGHKQNNNIVKLLKKWKVKGKGTVQNQIIEGNTKTLENKRLRNRRIIKKLIKSVYFMTKKHWAAHRNLTDFAKFIGNGMEESDIQYHLDSMAKNATYVSPESADAFLDSINTHLKNKLSEELYLTTKFTLKADKSTNASDNKALNIFVRYVCPISN